MLPSPIWPLLVHSLLVRQPRFKVSRLCHLLGLEGAWCKPPRLPGPHFPHLQMNLITVPTTESAWHSGWHMV